MGFYDNAPIKKAGQGGAKAKEGHYPQVLIHKVSIPPAGHHGTYFIAEYEVLDNGGNPDLSPVGFRGSWTTKLGTQFGYGESESSEFIAIAKGLTFDEVANSVEIRKGFLLQNEGAGTIMSTDAITKITDKNHKMNKHQWSLVSAPSAESRAQAAAGMTSPAPAPAPALSLVPPAAPPAPPAAPSIAGVTEEQIRAAGWVPNPNDPSGAYWFLAANPNAPQRTLESLKGGL